MLQRSIFRLIKSWQRFYAKLKLASIVNFYNNNQVNRKKEDNEIISIPY